MDKKSTSATVYALNQGCSTKFSSNSNQTHPKQLIQFSDRPILIFYNQYRYRLFVRLCTR